jgi:hypothetical protein
VRYHGTQGKDVLIIIVSEDGMINIMPNLRRRVSRARIEEVIVAVRSAAADAIAGRTPTYEAFFRQWRHLESLAFYLTEEQCLLVNEIRSNLEAHRTETSAMTLGWNPLCVDPLMDDSYLTD